MADSKELVVSDSRMRPDFIQELLPSVERTALLYHLSFLCLGGFPKLERLIRDQAFETQMLFGSSEAVLMKCVSTSSNLVNSLFPILINAIEKNEPVLAVKYLEKAKKWIDNIIRAVDDMMNRYEHQSRSVKTCTSDVFQEQKEAEDKKTKQTDEMKSLEDALANLQTELSKNVREMWEIDNNISRKNRYTYTYSYSWYCSYWSVLPIKYRFRIRNYARYTANQAELARLHSEKRNLQNKEWNIKIQQTQLQLKLANSKIQQGAIPSPHHLTEVQRCLDQIRQILVDLKKVWEKMGVMLKALEEKTFVGEELMDQDSMKDMFLISIEGAKKYWKIFGDCCQREQGIFSIQSKDAFKFLEINPSSLSENERKAQYKSIMEKLEKINLQVSSRAAITE